MNTHTISNLTLPIRGSSALILELLFVVLSLNALTTVLRMYPVPVVFADLLLVPLISRILSNSNFNANTAVYHVNMMMKSYANRMALSKQNSRKPEMPDLAPNARTVISMMQSLAMGKATESTARTMVFLISCFVNGVSLLNSNTLLVSLK